MQDACAVLETLMHMRCHGKYCCFRCRSRACSLRRKFSTLSLACLCSFAAIVNFVTLDWIDSSSSPLLSSHTQEQQQQHAAYHFSEQEERLADDLRRVRGGASGRVARR